MTAHIAYSDFSFNGKYRKNTVATLDYSRYTRAMLLNLKKIRKAKKMTQAVVAKRAGMSQSYYTEMENGTKQINTVKLQRIAEALECSVHQLIDDQQNPETAKLIELLSHMPDAQKKLVLELAEQLRQSSQPVE